MIQAFLWAAGMAFLIIIVFGLLYDIYDQLKNR
jgi:hypothetical protein